MMNAAVAAGFSLGVVYIVHRFFEYRRIVDGLGARYPKPIERFGFLRLFGDNIIATEGAPWKVHRKIAAPAFTEKNYRMVWNESVRIVQDLLDNEWKRTPEIKYEHVLDLTVPMSLFIIASAGFGQHMSWAEEKSVPAGYTMSFKDSLHRVSSDLHLKLLLPPWMLGLTSHLRKVRDAFDDFDKYLLEMIAVRRAAKEEHADLFSNLLKATELEADATSKLSDRELAGNIFAFLLAGHETTAHTLCFCLSYLALYPREQDRLYEEIKTVLADPDSLPAQIYEDMARLPYALACIYETLRLFPPLPGIPKVSGEDQSLVVTYADGERKPIPLPKGTQMYMSTVGMHQNPRYWSEPDQFRPDRFLGDWPKDAFIPFSVGARSCIGRRFSETEAVALLTMLLAHYRVSVTEDTRFIHETFEQRKARVLKARTGRDVFGHVNMLHWHFGLAIHTV
ncbi:cytochrome P450 [Vararia minispora EC-137]|uniref:Cytochrome P450 n=1 Tax=Vararia minispora EC-137 TaxID=1314806 RepID=A0ACB8QSK3_9AGAM|nr:cytochrome P450 [Vararia minispora EC-137]